MQAIAKYSLQCIHRPNEKNTKSFNHLFFSTLPMTFLKNEKSVILILWVKLDIAIMLRSQTQTAWLKIATASP